MATAVWLDRLKQLIADEAQLVEVLGGEYAEMRLPRAINILLKQLDAQSVGVLDRERAVVVYCWDSL
jgi:rhodanese-related sulfurtransferase